MNIVINFNKPENISSQQAVTKVKKIFAARKAGHTGTLDPIASGVLIVCLNEATKITRFLSCLDKEYIVRLKLGEKTDTYDLTGRIIKKTDFGMFHESDICDVLNNYKGQIKQIPPMYSAIKKDGKPLYTLARKGISIERPERTVHIYEIDLLCFCLPFIELRISCSKGTYIRTLCDDIGNDLGIGAHMVSLKRTGIGAFRIEDSVSLGDLKNKKGVFYSIDSALSHLGEVVLDEDSYRKTRNGIPIICSEIPVHSSLLKHDKIGLLKNGHGGFEGLYTNQYVRLKSPDNVVFGIGKVESDKIKIERLLNVSDKN